VTGRRVPAVLLKVASSAIVILGSGGLSATSVVMFCLTTDVSSGWRSRGGRR
jgi:hypothetical protein